MERGAENRVYRGGEVSFSELSPNSLRTCRLHPRVRLLTSCAEGLPRGLGRQINSSKGRTTDYQSVHAGSNPALIKIIVLVGYPSRCSRRPRCSTHRGLCLLRGAG